MLEYAVRVGWGPEFGPQRLASGALVCPRLQVQQQDQGTERDRCEHEAPAGEAAHLGLIGFGGFPGRTGFGLFGCCGIGSSQTAAYTRWRLTGGGGPRSGAALPGGGAT